MKYVLIILFIVYILAGLYLTLVTPQFRTRILKGHKLVNRRERWIYLILVVSFVIVIMLVILNPSIME